MSKERFALLNMYNFNDKFFDNENEKYLDSLDVVRFLNRYDKTLVEQKNKIANLEAKLAKKEELLEESEECKEFNAEMWTRFADKCKDLTKQLAEKEKERHEEWKTGKEWKWEWQKVNQQLKQTNQDKISFAVEKIQDLKKSLRDKVCFIYVWITP